MDLNCDSNCNESYYFILKSEMLNQQLKYKCDLTFMLYFVSLSTGSRKNQSNSDKSYISY